MNSCVVEGLNQSKQRRKEHERVVDGWTTAVGTGRMDGHRVPEHREGSRKEESIYNLIIYDSVCGGENSGYWNRHPVPLERQLEKTWHAGQDSETRERPEGSRC